MSRPGHLPLLSSRLQFSNLLDSRMSRTERQVNAFHYVVNSRPRPASTLITITCFKHGVDFNRTMIAESLHYCGITLQSDTIKKIQCKYIKTKSRRKEIIKIFTQHPQRSKFIFTYSFSSDRTIKIFVSSILDKKIKKIIF